MNGLSRGSTLADLVLECEDRLFVGRRSSRLVATAVA